MSKNLKIIGIILIIFLAILFLNTFFTRNTEKSASLDSDSTEKINSETAATVAENPAASTGSAAEATDSTAKTLEPAAEAAEPAPSFSLKAWLSGSTFDQSPAIEPAATPIDDTCNVIGIELHGRLFTFISNESYSENGVLMYDETSSDNITHQIEDAEADEEIKAIILEIDSWGGQGIAGEEIADALKRATKPTVTLIRSMGVSAAYFAATGSDVIFASDFSDVGGIGVTASYIDFAKQNEEEGITYNQLSSGPFKDLGAWDKSLTKEEKTLVMRDIEILHEKFVQAVAENRGLELEKVQTLADGSTMLGEMALENELIDYIGGLHEVENYLTELLNQPANVCWYQEG